MTHTTPRDAASTRGVVIYIYGLYDPRDGALRYVGKSNKPRLRYWMHMDESGGTHKNRWIASLVRAGHRPELRILEEIAPSDDWQDRERWWIQAARESGDDLTNHESGGLGNKRHAPETRAKMSAAATGRVMSPESIEKMKRTKRERMTDATRERLRLINLGRKQPQEEKDRRAASLRGQKRTPETRALLSANKKAYYARLRSEKLTHPE